MPGLGAQQLVGTALMNMDSNLDNIKNAADYASKAEEFKSKLEEFTQDNPINNATLIAGAVAATALAVGGAYYVISRRIDSIDDEREAFTDAVEKHVATYFIARQTSDRRSYDKYVATFIDNLEQYATSPDISQLLYQYSGLHKKTIDSEKKRGLFYSVFSVASLPFGVHFDQPRENGSLVDEAMQHLNFMLAGDFMQLMKKVAETPNKNPLSGVYMFFSPEDHVRWLNSTRMLGIIVSNITINIMQGVNPKTKSALTIKELHELCGMFASVLASMRSNIASSSYKINKDSLCEAAEFSDFLRVLAIRINALQLAYEKKLHDDPNLGDISSASHAVLKNATRPIRFLLYQDGRLEEPALFFSKLIGISNQIKRIPKIPNKLVRKLKLAETDFTQIQLNAEPRSVIDIIAIYASCYRGVRKSALKEFRDSKYKSFVADLTYLDDNFIQPIENKAHSYNYFGYKNQSAINPARIFFVAFVALMLETHNVALLDSGGESLGSNQQALQILAAQVESDAYHYNFAYFSSHLQLTVDTQEYIKALISLAIVARHLRLIETLTQTNVSYLQIQLFQNFITERLAAFSSALSKFIQVKNKLIKNANQDSSSDRDLIAVIKGIDHIVPNKYTKLPDLLEQLSGTIDLSRRIIVSSNFDDKATQQQLELVDMIEKVDPIQPSASGFYKALRIRIEASELGVAEDGYQEEDDFEAGCEGDSETTESQATMSVVTPNSYFQHQFMINILCRVSLVLLIIGLVIVAAIVLSPVDAATIGYEVNMALVLSGVAASILGGMGVATSCFLPEILDKPNKFIPVDTGSSMSLQAL